MERTQSTTPMQIFNGGKNSNSNNSMTEEMIKGLALFKQPHNASITFEVTRLVVTGGQESCNLVSSALSCVKKVITNHGLIKNERLASRKLDDFFATHSSKLLNSDWLATLVDDRNFSMQEVFREALAKQEPTKQLKVLKEGFAKNLMTTIQKSSVRCIQDLSCTLAAVAKENPQVAPKMNSYKIDAENLCLNVKTLEEMLKFVNDIPPERRSFLVRFLGGEACLSQILRWQDAERLSEMLKSKRIEKQELLESKLDHFFLAHNNQFLTEEFLGTLWDEKYPHMAYVVEKAAAKQDRQEQLKEIKNGLGEKVFNMLQNRSLRCIQALSNTLTSTAKANPLIAHEINDHKTDIETLCRSVKTVGEVIEFVEKTPKERQPFLIRFLGGEACWNFMQQWRNSELAS